MIHGFRNEMEWHSGYGPAFRTWEYNLNSFTSFNNEPVSIIRHGYPAIIMLSCKCFIELHTDFIVFFKMWLKSFIAENGHANRYKPIPSISEFDLNNNDVDVHTTTKQEILSATYRKVHFESNNQTYINVRD